MTTSYPTGESFASNFSTSSKTNSCPVYGRTKDRDCGISRDAKLVLCHQNFDRTKTRQADLWHFNGESSDNRCGVYVFKEKREKTIRPKQVRYWEYPARDGSPLVRVRREDFGDGIREKDIKQQRWDKDKKEYTGRKVEVVATYILKTKGQTFWPPEEVEKYGFQIIQFAPKEK